MQKRFFIICTLWLSSYLSPVDLQEKKLYLTGIHHLPAGFLITELSFPHGLVDQNFRLHQLSYSPIRKWEELRIEGDLEYSSKQEILLKAKKCSLLVSTGIRRWYPIRSFDCDHIKMNFLTHEKGAIIPEGPYGEKLEFKAKDRVNSSSITGIIVYEDEKYYYGFSSEVRYVLQKSKAIFLNKDGKEVEVPIVDGNDSLVLIQKGIFPASIGMDFFVKRKKNTESFLKI